LILLDCGNPAFNRPVELSDGLTSEATALLYQAMDLLSGPDEYVKETFLADLKAIIHKPRTRLEQIKLPVIKTGPKIRSTKRGSIALEIEEKRIAKMTKKQKSASTKIR